LEETLSLAKRLGKPAHLVDAHSQLARYFLRFAPEKGAPHLEQAEHHLSRKPSNEKRAALSLLSANFWLQGGEHENAKSAMAQFLLAGKRHFLPDLLVSLQDVGLIPFLFFLQSNPEHENAQWVLEEAAPMLQNRFNEILLRTPALGTILGPLVSRGVK
jgi:hypothetical protein